MRAADPDAPGVDGDTFEVGFTGRRGLVQAFIEPELALQAEPGRPAAGELLDCAALVRDGPQALAVERPALGAGEGRARKTPPPR